MAGQLTHNENHTECCVMNNNWTNVIIILIIVTCVGGSKVPPVLYIPYKAQPSCARHTPYNIVIIERKRVCASV